MADQILVRKKKPTKKPKQTITAPWPKYKKEMSMPFNDADL